MISYPKHRDPKDLVLHGDLMDSIAIKKQIPKFLQPSDLYEIGYITLPMKRWLGREDLPQRFTSTYAQRAVSWDRSLSTFSPSRGSNLQIADLHGYYTLLQMVAPLHVSHSKSQQLLQRLGLALTWCSDTKLENRVCSNKAEQTENSLENHYIPERILDPFYWLKNSESGYNNQRRNRICFN